MNKKDIFIGLGEIGYPLFTILSKQYLVVGYDLNPKIRNDKKLKKYESVPTELLHICIPFTKNFENSVTNYVNKYQPKGIVIHSTISPFTTEKIQKNLSIPVIYSATRGIHKRMTKDLQRYSKFYSVYDWAPQSMWASKNFVSKMKKAKIKTKKMSSPLVLELAKIVVDTSYYGWLINYAQLSNMIAKKHGVDYNEMWTFADEIHKFLGNRPKMFPGFIGGHCVVPNLELINDKTLNLIKEINEDYSKILEQKKNKKDKN